VSASAPTLRIAWPRIGSVNRRLAILLAALLAVFGLLLGDRLFNGAALRSMAFQMPELGLLSLAMMVPLLSGGLDLSIIATANLVALAIAFLFHAWVPAGPGWLWAAAQLAAVLAGLLLAVVVGAVNGMIIADLEVSPILTTLGAMTLIKGISIGLTHGEVISGFTAPLVFIGNGSLLGIPLVLLIFIVIAAAITVMLNRTPFGHILHMLGSNEAATRYSGIDTRRVLVRVYVTSSLLAALAGIVMMARFNSANAAYGESYLLVTILAAVLGGVAPSGGFGKVAGLIFALVILQLISTAFNLLNFSQFVTLAIWGGTLIAVAAAARLRGYFGKT
jgi:ribose/xylose/arabinose/galactoside ABC-type transport system permease subunit